MHIRLTGIILQDSMDCHYAFNYMIKIIISRTTMRFASVYKPLIV